MRTLAALVVATVMAVVSQTASAMSGMNVSVSTLALNSATTQGGLGPQGTTILTQGDIVYTDDWYSIGVFCMFDFQGSNQKDLMLGPKIEINAGPFFAEGGFAFLTRRDFTDRSIVFQRGNGFFAGVGLRFGLESEDSGWFFQASYKIRIQNLTLQDSVALDQPIRIQDGYPLVGIGLNF